MSNVTLGRVWGIPIRLHWSFLLVLPLFAYLIGEAYFAAETGATLVDYLWGGTLAVALFASVVAHELGHSWTARRYGVPIKSITLLPIGGVAQMERMPEEPRQEMWVALAGPLVSIGIGLPILGVHELGLVPALAPKFLTFVFWAGALNVFLGGFNLLVPAFPMDGGRVLRAGLTGRYGRKRATEIAGMIGQGLAVVMGIVGFLTLSEGGWLLLLIALFIYMGASQEVKQVRSQVALHGLTVGDAMTEEVRTISPDQPVAEVVEAMRSTRHVDFPVVEGGRAIGLVSLDDVDEVPREDRETTRVREMMDETVPRLGPGDPAREALDRLGRSDDRLLFVEEQGRLVGVVSETDLVRLIRILESS